MDRNQINKIKLRAKLNRFKALAAHIAKMNPPAEQITPFMLYGLGGAPNADSNSGFNGNQNPA